MKKLKLTPLLPPPIHEAELLARCENLSGKTFEQLAQPLNIPLPGKTLHGKGWLGQVVEAHLGANAGSLSEPDFQQLAIELKTLPVDAQGKVLETTFIATIPLLNLSRETWQTSAVYKKLQRVLWLPVEGDRHIPFEQRRVGTAILWQPSEEQLACLQRDWQELTDMLSLGKIEQVNAHHGQYLQVRPKAANSKALCWAIGPDGSRIQTLPRGFYLRSQFTQQIMDAAFN